MLSRIICALQSSTPCCNGGINKSPLSESQKHILRCVIDLNLLPARTWTRQQRMQRARPLSPRRCARIDVARRDAVPFRRVRQAACEARTSNGSRDDTGRAEGVTGMRDRPVDGSEVCRSSSFAMLPSEIGFCKRQRGRGMEFSRRLHMGKCACADRCATLRKYERPRLSRTTDLGRLVHVEREQPRQLHQSQTFPSCVVALELLAVDHLRLQIESSRARRGTSLRHAALRYQ